MSLEEIKNVTVNQLVAWIQEEKARVEERIPGEFDLVTKGALDAYRENLGFFEQDIMRLAKGIVFERAGTAEVSNEHH